uniref:Putative mitochondrial protein n=1 Tax=Noccaea caerulescens TaxID=107243 RepID=A0A1J3K2W1_NOCCA
MLQPALDSPLKPSWMIGKRAFISGALTPSISEATNQELIKDPSVAEIKEAMFAIHPDKAPGPDGFSASFFQTNWSIVGPDVVSEVQAFFRQGVMPRTSNDTLIRLIPSRGIRQGDPLSPYIFILCSEVLSGLCKKAQVSGKLQGLRVARGSPRVNHLLFADDTMFFLDSLSILEERRRTYSQQLLIESTREQPAGPPSDCPMQGRW